MTPVRVRRPTPSWAEGTRKDAAETTTPVVILTASPRARRSPHGGIGIIRSLGRMGVPVYIVDSDPPGPASYSRYVRRRFVFDIDTNRPDEAVEYLKRIGGSMAYRPILVPTWDEASLMVSDFADVLREQYLFPDQPQGLARSLASKKEMYRLAREHGVPTPVAVFPSSISDVRGYAATATFPVMLKGISGNRLLEHAGQKMAIVEGPDDLFRLYEAMEDLDQPNLMLQEYIPGGDDTVWMFNGYFDSDSECLFGMTGRKLRQTPVYTGATSLGVCERNDVVDRMTRKWMNQLGYRGILDIGYRFDSRDGTYKVLDVNPRIGGTFRLFVARNGMDVARAQYLDLTGQRVPPSEPVEGRKWMDDRDIQSSLQYRRDGRLGMRQWATSMIGVRESVYFARDDLVPFAQHARYLATQVAPGLRSRSTGRGEPADARQVRTDEGFDRTAGVWREIYQGRSVKDLIYQERRATALEWIDSLDVPAGSPALEIGCGAGLVAVNLAERGLDVTATDTVPAMIDQASQLAESSGVEASIRFLLADAHELPFDDGSFTLVVALGVVPWLHSPGRGLAEMFRVVRPGGFVLATADNALGLHYLLDPRMNPAFTRLRHLVAVPLWRLGLRRQPSFVARLDRPRRFRAMVAEAGLEREREATVGFGPLTVWRRPILSQQEGRRLHRTLQRLADSGVPLVRTVGAQHMILARRPRFDRQAGDSA